MQSILHLYVRIIDLFNRFIGWLLMIILGMMSVFVFWQVFTRYVIGSSSSWSEELARFLMIWLVLLGAALALRKGELIAVEILPEVFNKGTKGIKITTHLISFVFYYILIVYGWELANQVAVQMSPGLHLSMFWVYLALPAGGIVLFLNSTASIIEVLLENRG